MDYLRQQWPLWLERYLEVSAFHHHPDFPGATKELGDGAVFCDLEWGGSWAFHGPGLKGAVQGAEEEAALVPLWDSQSSVFSSSRRLLCFCSASFVHPLLPAAISVFLSWLFQLTLLGPCFPHYKLTNKTTKFSMMFPPLCSHRCSHYLFVSSLAQLPSFLSAPPSS